MILVISSSLHPTSRSRILARACTEHLTTLQRKVELFDLAESALPLCDGSTAYGDPNAKRLGELVESADAILMASPIYNYDVNAAAKNAVELTGRAWTGKVVGLMLAAGGQTSYMSAMGLANSLMLDFRCLVIPRFIYATGDCFEGDFLTDESIQERLELLVAETIRIADALRGS
ncbi:MAG: NAD(P)H-dependent oxidoreductase [Rubripirellula sp.]|nr:NAD(P)H-dependent oxidoreductase [Rubripirellula sp.]